MRMRRGPPSPVGPSTTTPSVSAPARAEANASTSATTMREGADTPKPRLHPDEIAYIANDARDRMLIVDDVLLPLYEKIVAAGAKFERVFVVGGDGGYEALLAGAPDVALPKLDERDALGVCYTS